MMQIQADIDKRLYEITCKMDLIREEQLEKEGKKKIEIRCRLIEIKKITSTTSELTYIEDNKNTPTKLDTNQSAEVFQKFLGKEVIIKGIVSREKNSVCLVTSMEECIYEKEIEDYFQIEDIEHYKSCLEKLSDSKKEALKKEYCKTVNHKKPIFNDNTMDFKTIDELKVKTAVLAKSFPPAVYEEINYIFEEFSHSISSGDKAVLRKVLDYLVNFSFLDNDTNSPEEVEETLDKIIGMESIKKILSTEYRAFKKKKLDGNAPKCLLFVGSPGSGIESTIDLFAKATHKNYATYNLAGIKDILSLLGSSRCYENANVGSFAKTLFRVGTHGIILLENLDCLFDETCKSALSQILQRKYRNEMLEVTLDLSGTWFFATAMDTKDIPKSILDECVIVNIPQYSESEIKEIAQQYVKEFCQIYHLNDHKIRFSNEAIESLYSKYSRKNNIEDLKNNIEDVFKSIIEMQIEEVTITEDNLNKYFSLLQRGENIISAYASNASQIIEKAIICRSYYPETVAERIDQLRNEFQVCNNEATRIYALECLRYLTNTLLTNHNEVDLDMLKMNLEQSVYGHNQVKEQFMDALIPCKNSRYTSILLNGAPGISKTTFARVLANSLRLPLIEIHMNETRDESKIAGTAHTIKDSTPGLFKELSKNGSYSAVVLLDEVDKINFRTEGNPYNALYNLLDEGDIYYDNWLEVAYPVNNIIFILTSNSTSHIPYPLLNRVKVIEMTGYSTYEKEKIASEFLIPKLLDRFDMKGRISFSNNAVNLLIRKYTYDIGARDMEHGLETVIRRTIRRYNKSNNERKQLLIQLEDIKRCLGTPNYGLDSVPVDRNIYGQARALAVNGVGMGCSFAIQCVENPLLNDNIKITGLVEDSASESIQVAITLASVLLNRKIQNLHIHMTCAGVPKSGPSAGIAIFVSIMSLFTKTIVPFNVAFTGELTLAGDVQSIGGVKEKLIAAENFAVETVYIPDENYCELRENGDLNLFRMSIVPIKSIFDIVAIFFPPLKNLEEL